MLVDSLLVYLNADESRTSASNLCASQVIAGAHGIIPDEFLTVPMIEHGLL